MADLLFAFEQSEIDELIENSTDTDDINFSLFSAQDPTDGKRRLFLAAVPSSVGANASTVNKIPVGCPVPPGWSQPLPTITLAQLVNAPTFSLGAASKSKLKENNTGDQLEVGIQVEINETTTPNSVATKLSFKVKNSPTEVDASLI